jgi:DeoR/GlpR family transcriptional regulator of sugar metabolism
MRAMVQQRRAEILEELRRGERVTVADLSRRFGISEVSVRRDMRHLEERGLLKRVYGGAVPILDVRRGQPIPDDLDPLAQKRSIGKAGAALLAHGDCIILDSGSTTLQVAAHISQDLLDHGQLTIITASLPIVRQLGSHRGLHLIVLGGLYDPDRELMAGPQTVEGLKSLHADKMFLGTDGMSFSQGLTTANVLEAEVDRAMVRASTEVIAVADCSKIGRIGLATIMPLNSINKLITDTGSDPEFVVRLREDGVEVVLV